MRYRVSVLAMLAACAAGCATTPDAYEQRMQDTYAFVDAWENAVSGGSDDRGWSLLSPAAQRGFFDEAAYVALAEAADWSRFELTTVGGHCDDLWMCSIRINLPRDPTAIPEFLTKPPLDDDGKLSGLLVVHDQDDDGVPDAPKDDLGNGSLWVWWERVPWSDPGVGGSLGG